MPNLDSLFIAFAGEQQIAYAPLRELAVQVRDWQEAHPEQAILVFDAKSSEQFDFDCRGSAEAVLQKLEKQLERMHEQAAPILDNQGNSGPGRPKLGVVAREVTLLPRHWEWLNAQPGGASVTLRKLVEQARRNSLEGNSIQAAQTATYRFMLAMAGNCENFDEANRALFANDEERFSHWIASWPSAIRQHVEKLAKPAFPEKGTH